MATSSTNKQPLLVDRPLLEVVSIGGSAGLAVSANLNSPLPSGLTLLVDCSENDGAVLDSITITLTENFISSESPYGVIIALFLSDGQNYYYVGSGNLNGISYICDQTNVPLPPINTPVPDVRVIATDAQPSWRRAQEVDKKNTALLIPAGRQLYVGVNEPITEPSTSSRVIVTAQGGYY